MLKADVFAWDQILKFLPGVHDSTSAYAAVPSWGCLWAQHTPCPHSFLIKIHEWRQLPSENLQRCDPRIINSHQKRMLLLLLYCYQILLYKNVKCFHQLYSPQIAFSSLGLVTGMGHESSLKKKSGTSRRLYTKFISIITIRSLTAEESSITTRS